MAAVLVTMAALLPVALAIPAAAAGPVAALVSSNEWAYGGQRWINASGTSMNGTYSAEAFLGWHVILSQTNTSATSFTLHLQRSMGAALLVNYCRPSCTAPTAKASVNVKAWEVADAWANFTTAGSVTTTSGAVAALALVDSSETTSANLTQQFSVVSSVARQAQPATGTLWVETHAHAQVEFTPALGLLPLNPTSGESWMSSASYVASGGWSAAYTLLKTFANGTGSHATQTLSGSVAGDGNLTLYGAVIGPVNLVNGLAATGIVIGVTGPFHPREGLILLPGAADVFGKSNQAWEANLSTRPLASTAVVDVRPGAAGHLGLVASATTYTGSSSMPVAAGVVPAVVSPQNGTPTTVVQAEPETVAQAQAGSTCVTGSCLNLVMGGGGSSALPLSAWLVPFVILAAAVIVVALVTTRHRRVVPPLSTNASLYPPGAALAPPPSVPGTAPGKNPPPSTSDPLDHLW